MRNQDIHCHFTHQVISLHVILTPLSYPHIAVNIIMEIHKCFPVYVCIRHSVVFQNICDKYERSEFAEVVRETTKEAIFNEEGLLVSTLT